MASCESTDAGQTLGPPPFERLRERVRPNTVPGVLTDSRWMTADSQLVIGHPLAEAQVHGTWGALLG